MLTSDPIDEFLRWFTAGYSIKGARTHTGQSRSRNVSGWEGSSIPGEKDSNTVQ